MNCENARQMISSRLDGMLAAADARSLDEHLGACAPCREDLADQESLHALFGDDRAAFRKPPGDLNDRIMARVARGDRDEGRVIPFRTGLQRFAVAAAVLFLLAGGYMLGQKNTAAGVDELAQSIERSKREAIEKGANPAEVDALFRSYQEEREKVSTDADKKFAEAYERLDRGIKKAIEKSKASPK